MRPGWYRNGMWIFRISSTRGGVGVVTQELALCYQGDQGSATKMWHSLHGGGAPLLVLSCETDAKEACRLYQDGYAEGAWSDGAQ